jgi:hypothetical protein
MRRYLGPVQGRPTNLVTPDSFLWLFRIVWVALAIAVATALDGTMAAAAWWVLVAVAAVALTVTGPLGLTVVRLATSLAAPVAVIAWIDGASTALGAAITLVALLATFVAASAEVGEAMVQGAAYGDEFRFPLRLPAAMFIPVALMWLVWAAAVLGGTLLVVNERWIVGVVVAGVAAAATWWLGPRFHRLSRRWLVLVPAGVVVHDQVLMAETMLVQRTNIAAARLALAGSEAFDLTGPAGGHALDIAVRDMVQAIFPASAKEPTGRAVHLQSFLVAPSRPGRVLQAMAERKLPVG